MTLTEALAYAILISPITDHDQPSSIFIGIFFLTDVIVARYFGEKHYTLFY